MTALFWFLKGKKLRGWNLLCAAAARNHDFYRRWAEVAEPVVISRYCHGAPARKDEGVASRLVGLVLSVARDAPDAADASIASLRNALGENVVIWTNAPGGTGAHSLSAEIPLTVVQALEMLLDGDEQKWLLVIRAGDLVSPFLGPALDRAFVQAGANSIIYWDEDRFDNGRRGAPWIKPDWDDLLFCHRDMISGASVVDCSALLDVARANPAMPLDPEHWAALMVEMASHEMAHPPYHIPLVLSHRRDGVAFVSGETWRHIMERHIGAPVPASEDIAGWPKISILIPTRDGADILATCLAGLERLQYPGETEWIVIDNGSTDPAALKLFRTWAEKSFVRVVSIAGPFNFALLNNRAAALATGEFLCLLNNDVEPLDGEWLTAMIRHARHENAGAVGALLLYPDRTVQHAGVAIGIGDAAGHVQKGVSLADERHPCWCKVSRRVSAVTAACLVVSREKYLAVGGMDEEAFAVAFNDVDLCLKLDAEGWRNLFVAEAVLIHHESKSRGLDHAPENITRFTGELVRLQERWQTVGYSDPYFSPLFSRSSEQCLLAF
jgi:GT2 family glycosyltransferase